FDMAEADVVCAENEFDALLFARDRILQLIIELPQISARAFDALPRITRIDAHLPRRARHDLHQTHRACPRSSVRIEPGLLIRLRRDEPPVPSRNLRILPEPVVIRREPAGLDRQIRAVRTRCISTPILEVLTVERGEKSMTLLQFDPLIQR